MEVPLTPGEEKPEETTDKKSTGRVRNAAEVVQQWLHFRAAEKPNEVENDLESDDDEEEEESTLKRWRAIFKKFFNSQVDKQEQPVEETTATSSFEQPRLPLFLAETPDETVDAPIAPLVETAPLGADSEVLLQQNPVQEIEPISPSVVENATDTPVEVPIDPLVAARYEQPESTVGAAPPTVETVTPTIHATEAPLYSRPTPEVVPRQTGDVYDDAVARHDEVNLQRSNLINTYRNHRRKKDIRETNHRVEALKQEQEATRTALQQEIEEVKAKLKAEQAAIEKAAVPNPVVSRVETPATTPVAPEAAPQPKVAKPEVAPVAPETKAAPVQAPESVKEILEKRTVEARPQVQQQAEKLATHSYEAVNPETVFEQVEQAAEADVAIEGLFERRHEVKDNDATYKADDPSTASGGFVPVSPQIHAVNGQLPSSPTEPQKVSRWASNKPKNSEEAYKQAAIGGFWAAIMLLVLIGILLIVR